MKRVRRVVVVLGSLLVVGSSWLLWAQAQQSSILSKSEARSAAVIVEAAREGAGLEPVAEKTIPVCSLHPSGPPGSYWMLQTHTPPLPFNPFPELIVYSLGESLFLVDDRSVDYPGLRLLQAEETRELRDLESRVSSQMGKEAENGKIELYGSLLFYNYTTNDLWLEILTVTNTIGQFRIHSPVTNGVYDLFATTNLSPSGTGLNQTNWTWLLRCTPGQTNLTVTNLSAEQGYFRLGGTNDTDGGGFSDAFERWVTHTDPNNPADDRLVPQVSVYVTDSVAVEQQSTNTARFVISRLGGRMGQPLTVNCFLSGSAIYGTDHWLTPASVSGTNMTITIPFGQSSVEITLSAMNDSIAEGTETVTLTLATNVAWEVDTAHSSATAWILESYTHVFTLNADFNLGVMAGLETVNDQLQFKTNLPPQFPFINVACSARGTVARINTTNGQVIGEYLTAPTNLVFNCDGGVCGPSPSRTTVDQFGNVWVANRNDTLQIGRTNYGSITRIGLIIGGTRFSKTNNVYYPDPNGQYMSISNATYNTCIDRDGDGFIRTSRGLADILPWNNQRDGMTDVDSYGGVSTAEDEAITEYVRVLCTGTRTIAVDKFNDIWVGGHTGNRTHLKVNGLTGSVVPNSAFDTYQGGYGGVIDSLGNLWSSPNGNNNFGVVWLKPPTVFPVQSNNWRVLFASGTSPYGIAVDPLHPYIWQTSVGDVFRWRTNGVPVTNAYGQVVLFPHHASTSQGLVVDTNGHVWVAQSTGANTVGHLNTNGVWLGNVLLRLYGLRAEYFANTNLSGTPVLVRADGPVDFDWGNGSPNPAVPTNYFSARWTGIVQPQGDGQHVFFVSADAGAGFRLTVNGSVIINNWNNPNTNSVEMRGSNLLSMGNVNSIQLEYKESTGDAKVKLSWNELGTTNKVVIPRSRLSGQDLGDSPTGVSVDSFSKIWVANQGSSDAMRIDLQAGQMVVTNGVTNYLGAVDMVVPLGNGTTFNPHTPPYNVAASPYNYSDMTGFNNRVVNPGLQPLKGYWTVIEDGGITNQWWQRVSWSNNLPITGCEMQVFVRASNDRRTLSNEPFVSVTNNVSVIGVRGRFIEMRVAFTRDAASKQPALYDLTLYGSSSSFVGGFFLDDVWAYETEDAWFSTDLTGPAPLTYQWFIQHPWTNQWKLVTNAIGSQLLLTNVDLWDDWTRVNVSVSNAAGQLLWLGPAELAVFPLSIGIPASGSSGVAQRYPATINVRGQRANFSRVEVTLHNLRHTYPADLDILLVSPSGIKIMLMSDAGGTTGVTNATLVFHPGWEGYGSPPCQTAIPSDSTWHYSVGNCSGGDSDLMPSPAPAGPYTGNIDNLPTTDPNPNGIWKLYINDDKSGDVGVISGSWSLEFFYP